jgi:trehalose/maltose transport system substrate-binding protein
MKLLCWPIAVFLLLCAGCRTAKQTHSPVKLSILGFGLEAGAQLRQDALDEFTAKTGTQVDVVPTLGTSADQLELMRKFLQRGSPAPDVYLVDVIWSGTLHEHLLDLTPYLTENDRKHIPALIENATVGNRIVSLPFYMNAGMLFYRADLLKKYGYDAPPATWSELQAAARRIQQGERRAGSQSPWGYIWQGGAYEGLTCNALEWQASFGGGHIVESNGTVSVNSPQTARALKAAAKTIDWISPKSVLSYTESDTMSVFRSGGAVFMRYWSSGLRIVTKTMPAGSAGIALLPAGPGGRVQAIGGFQLAVSKYSAHAREAADLVRYLAGAEVQKRRALLRGYLPTRTDLHEDTEIARALPQMGLLRNAAPESWVARPSTVSRDKYGQVSKAYYEAVHNILAGQTKVGPTLAALEQQLIQITGVDGNRRD